MPPPEKYDKNGTFGVFTIRFLKDKNRKKFLTIGFKGRKLFTCHSRGRREWCLFKQFWTPAGVCGCRGGRDEREDVL